MWPAPIACRRMNGEYSLIHSEIGMVSHRRRQLFESDKAALLIGACREACIESLRRAPIDEEIPKRAQALMHAIDDVAEVLTGDRRHFWLKPHGGPKV